MREGETWLGRFALCGGMLAALASSLPAQVAFPEASSQQSATDRSAAQQQVIEQLLAQPIGAHRVADLGMPEAYLRRVVDRIIRSSFESRFRIVVRAEGAGAPEAGIVPRPQGDPDSPASAAAPANDETGGSSLAPWMPIAIGAVVILIVGRLMARRKGDAPR